MPPPSHQALFDENVDEMIVNVEVKQQMAPPDPPAPAPVLAFAANRQDTKVTVERVLYNAPPLKPALLAEKVLLVMITVEPFHTKIAPPE